MIKKILGSALLIVSVVGGAVAADFLKYRGSGDDMGHASAESKDGKADKKNSKGKQDSSKDDLADMVNGPSYLKFKRQFVVPILKGDEMTLLEAGQQVVNEGIRDILILDIARQDQ